MTGSTNPQKQLIVICGPTAVGKTAISIELAQHFQCPIISFDSRQFYKEMSIGTAKPDADELAAAEHHFISNRSIEDEVYTAGKFEADALRLLDELFQEHDVCIAVGGSGLYIDALCYGIDDIPSDSKVRKELEERWQTEGLEVLQKEVLEIDPDFYHESDMQNPRRVMRALEAYQLTGKTYSILRTRTAKKRPFSFIWIGLEQEREILFDRINQRVDIMMEKGLLEEVKQLEDKQDLKALKTVGYREIFSYLKDEYDLEEAIRLIKRNSRQYAKKQITWFKKNEAVIWFNPDQKNEIIAVINKKIIG
ncbi:MAG: tRNA (adenosine(37)-N6)-dimethylallyltransferase MiaA [Flavobacteriales bacterium]|nr:tRNA (adenosine(37)-N6)-dimethylallyltransferase MiaA [Flavobacteriales bacterium]